MKLRIRANSIRVRLSQSEVAILGAGHAIIQTTEFAIESTLVCRVEPTDRVTSAAATFNGNCIIIQLPLRTTQAWATSDQVALQASQPITRERSLVILVEKDFECLHSKEENDSDAFPNPRLS